MGKCAEIRKRKKTKKNQAEIRRFTSTIQMVLNSPLSWTLIAVQKKGKLKELCPFVSNGPLWPQLWTPQSFSCFRQFFEGLGLN